MKKWIAILALVLVACMAFAGCAQPAADDSAARTQIVVGTSADYPPFEFHILDENGKDKIVGLDMALAAKIAEDMGVELVIKDMSFDFILEDLNQGNIDIAISGLESRGDTFTYSDAYYTDYPTMLVIRKADAEKFTSVESFANATIGVQSGTTKVDVLTETLPDAQPLMLTTVPEIINNVLFEKCDGAILDGSVALSYVEANEELMICEAVSMGEAAPYFVVVQKDDPQGLLESVNKTIADAIENGLIDQWSEEADALSAEAIS